MIKMTKEEIIVAAGYDLEKLIQKGVVVGIGEEHHVYLSNIFLRPKMWSVLAEWLR